MVTRNWEKIEADFFRQLNQWVEPLVRAGLGSPLPWSSGAIVLETTGRKSGQLIKVPLLATRIGDLVLIGTVRPGSQWLKNLAANPQVKYWIYGQPRSVTAFVFARNVAQPQAATLPQRAAGLANLILPQCQLFGVSFAILVP
ncbi:MAG: nitroreductase family deazaflavin-dependent oxidoreductase [Acidobacteria bacterium]|nr:nitroreductase family deazaflavin-dependent oxidoreductase [Acidobacteriota bacterium]